MSFRAPLILILAGFMISTSVILFTEIVGQERRDPYQEDRGVRTLPKQQQPQYYQPPPPRHDDHSDEPITDQIATIFLDQGWIGGMLLLVMGYMHVSQKQARADRIKLEDKLVDLLTNNNKELAKFSAELDNLSREVERIRG
jgi:hypothetical protein